MIDPTVVDMYLDFSVHRCGPRPGATERYRIVSLTDDLLGMIDYHHSLRRWVFRPAMNTAWFRSMLEGVADVIRKLTEGGYNT